MKQLPDEKTLLELLELAKDAEKSARETGELAAKIAYKWQKRLQMPSTAHPQEQVD